MSEFKVIDKRKTGDPTGSPIAAPASLSSDDIVYQKVTPETNFLHPGPGRVIMQEDNFSYKGRIITPQKAEKRPTTGVIVEVGKGVEDYQVGDRIVCGIYSGTVVTFKGWDPKKRINLRALSVDDIIGTLDAEAPEAEGVGV